MFKHSDIRLDVLKRKAFNYRWAEVNEGVIPLTAADPDFPVAPEIVEAIKRYASDHYFSYGPPHGELSFKEAVANYYKKNFNATVNPDFVLPVNSAAYGLYVVMQHILSENGGNVIVPDPVDFLFRKSVEHAGGEVRPCEMLSGSACFDMTQLVNLIDENTRAIMICNPNNPLGLQIDRAHIQVLVELAESKGIYIVSDEIWADIHFGKSVDSLYSELFPKYERSVVVSGLSKNYGLSGFRIGYIIARNAEIYQSIFMQSGHAGTAFGLQPIAQAAGTAALNECQYWLDAFRSHLISMKTLCHQFLSESRFLSPVETDATYLIFPKLSGLETSSEAYVQNMHQRAKVALVPGGLNWFEKASEGRVRICFASSDVLLQEAFSRLLEAEKHYFI